MGIIKQDSTKMKHIILRTLIIGLLLIGLNDNAIANENMADEIDRIDQPDLPDTSHQFLALHAAESHGNTPEQAAWIAQGAYDEDHQSIPKFGWHGWDPDTGETWWSPLGYGPAPERANALFRRAVELHPTEPEAAWKKLVQSLHLLQDLSTPAHAHADPHVCALGDCDAYETWLGVDDLVNTLFWINLNPPDPTWNKSFTKIPTWNELTTDLKDQLEAANLVYGGHLSGKEFWESGITDIDPILFQLLYLIAESADDYNSGGTTEYPGEKYNGDLDDPGYLSTMRDDLFPLVIEYSTMWIGYFEYQISVRDHLVFLPLLTK